MKIFSIYHSSIFAIDSYAVNVSINLLPPIQSDFDDANNKRKIQHFAIETKPDQIVYPKTHWRHQGQTVC